ncbi:hypothetical protein [Rhizobium laguerreae]|uniref:hypothetical protein n=1 Tax=Rhizobium laguerreae TaxID=1076926 RepID=UPI001C8FC071|nr:hypothetical protein [Rhizobium laguerreae]MBY3211776.1 hypothetical protein [Rhizobium laguerreae]
MNDEDKLKAEIFWKLYSEHCVQGRHHETQRSTVIGVILAVAAAMTGIATFDEALGGATDTAISCFLIFLGLFGAGFSLKHYERFNLHMQRARHYRDALDDLIPGKPIAVLKDQADKLQKVEFPIMSKWRLYYWWVALNFAVSLLGIALFVNVLFFPTSGSQ